MRAWPRRYIYPGVFILGNDNYVLIIVNSILPDYAACEEIGRLGQERVVREFNSPRALRAREHSAGCDAQ